METASAKEMNDFTLRSVILLALVVLGGLTVVAQDSVPKVISSEEFKLSEAAEKAGIDGTLVISVEVSETGTVKSAEVVAGPAWPCGENPSMELALLRDAVKQNIMSARFTPALKNGKPQASQLRIKFAVGEAYKAMLARRKTEEGIRNGTIKEVFGGVLNGKATSLPRPPYPAAARAIHVGGTVTVEILIDEQGAVVRAGATSGHPLLQPEARRAACGAKFSPTMLDGKPVKVSGVITYNFMP